MRADRKVKQGIVTSTKMQKTIVVRVDEAKAHAKYQKTITVSKNYHVHDEKNEALLGDEVLIAETRPLLPVFYFGGNCMRNGDQGRIFCKMSVSYRYTFHRCHNGILNNCSTGPTHWLIGSSIL